MYFHSIIAKPDSGDYPERYFDIDTEWKDDAWAWIKFLTKKEEEWVGTFRGEAYGFAYSEKTDLCIVLTSQGLYKINVETGELLKTEDRLSFNLIEITPDQNTIILGYYYYLERMDWNFNRTRIDSPLKMDMVKFNGWDGDVLVFKFDEFLNWEKHYTAGLNFRNWKVEIIK